MVDAANITTRMGEEPNIIGFGEHSSPVSYSTYKTAKIVSEIALALLLTGAIVTAVVLTGMTIIPVLGTLPILGAVGSFATPALFAAASSLLAAGAVSSVVYYRSCKNALFGVMNKIIDKIEQPTGLGKSGKCAALVCEDTMESFEWKKRLIEAAEHNIVISGNYCGGHAFDEVLELIHKQMAAKPDLKVVVISSDKFISEENHKRIAQLRNDFSDRFQLVESPDIYHINPSLKLTTNHSKILAIDYGRYFLLGGSGLEDKYAMAKGLGDRGDKEAPKTGGLLGMFLPRGFRDQDFVFHSDEELGIGKRVYIESLKLALRWEGLNTLKAFTTDVDLAHSFQESQSVAKDLLLDEAKDKVKTRPKPTTHITDFHSSDKVNENCSTKIYCTGPEHTVNPFEKELITRFSEAKERIVVDHMYFHPTEAVLKALIKAANRGVKITIVTNGYDEKKSPKGHQFFGPRNRYNYCLLKNGVKKKARKNINVYEFKVRKTTLHKKVIVVDDYVIAGSSNLGYKSLVTMSDHEMNFVTRNKEFADQTADVALNVDAKVDAWDKQGKKVESGFARKVNNFDIGLATRISAARHRVMAPLIG